MRPAPGVPAFVLATVVVAGSAAAQDGPVMLTGLPLGAIDTGMENGPVVEAALPTGTSTGQATPAPEGGGVSLDLDVVAKQLNIAAQNIQPSLGASVYNFGRQSAVQPAVAPGPGRRPRFVRPAPCPGRSRQSPISPKRGDPARGNQRLR